MKQIFFAFFMMQMNLTSFNIPLEVCKHISSTCLVGSLKLCRSTQIWDLMNSSNYNKNWKKNLHYAYQHYKCTYSTFFFNRKFASKHKIHHIQIDTIFNPANRRKEFTVLFFFLLTMHNSANTNSFWYMHTQKQINDHVW